MNLNLMEMRIALVAVMFDHRTMIVDSTWMPSVALTCIVAAMKHWGFSRMEAMLPNSMYCDLAMTAYDFDYLVEFVDLDLDSVVLVVLSRFVEAQLLLRHEPNGK